MRRHGQSFIEYMCFLAVCIAAIVVMSTYIKRGLMGNWHTQTISVYPDLYDKSGSSSFSMSTDINSTFVGFGKGSAPWINDGHGWSLWQ